MTASSIHKSYSRGYYAGLKQYRPIHELLPVLTESDVLPLLVAAQKLRHEFDALMATCSPGDYPAMEAAVDAWDAAMNLHNLARIEALK